MVSSRIWGEWKVVHYPTGKPGYYVRQEREDPKKHKPHLKIEADEAISARIKHDKCLLMCEEIARYLNGGEPPPWLEDMERGGDEWLWAIEGARIVAVGPFSLVGAERKIVECSLRESRLLRKKLIDQLVKGTK